MLRCARNDEAVVRNDEVALYNDEAVVRNDEAALRNDEAVLCNDEAALYNDEAVVRNAEVALYNDGHCNECSRFRHCEERSDEAIQKYKKIQFFKHFHFTNTKNRCKMIIRN